MDFCFSHSLFQLAVDWELRNGRRKLWLSMNLNHICKMEIMVWLLQWALWDLNELMRANAESSLGLENVSYQHYHPTLPCLSKFFVVGAESPDQISRTLVTEPLKNNLEEDVNSNGTHVFSYHPMYIFWDRLLGLCHHNVSR